MSADPSPREDQPSSQQSHETGGAPSQNDALAAQITATTPTAPQEIQRTIRQVFQTALQVGPSEDPLIARMTPEHVTSIIANKERADQRQFDLSWRLMLVIPISILLLCLLFLGFGQSERLKEIVALMIGFAGGFGVGKLKKD
jgi:hypothetical protein